MFSLVQCVLFQQPTCEGYTYLCPKLTEITNCNEDGIEGYTTFRLSVITKPNMNIQNLYALYGDVDGNHYIFLLLIKVLLIMVVILVE